MLVEGNWSSWASVRSEVDNCCCTAPADLYSWRHKDYLLSAKTTMIDWGATRCFYLLARYARKINSRKHLNPLLELLIIIFAIFYLNLCAVVRGNESFFQGCMCFPLAAVLCWNVWKLSAGEALMAALSALERPDVFVIKRGNTRFRRFYIFWGFRSQMTIQWCLQKFGASPMYCLDYPMCCPMNRK